MNSNSDIREQKNMSSSGEKQNETSFDLKKRHPGITNESSVRENK